MCIRDRYEDTVERIVKREYRDRDFRGEKMMYSLYRYFTIGDGPVIHVSVDLENVDADHVIQHLAERL